MLISRAARSLSSRFGATRATLATRATAGGGAHPAPPLPHREGELDKEREREETRRDSRGNSRELDVSRLDAEAEKGPIEKSLHSAKGKIKEAVGESKFLFFFRLLHCRRCALPPTCIVADLECPDLHCRRLALSPTCFVADLHCRENGER